MTNFLMFPLNETKCWVVQSFSSVKRIYGKVEKKLEVIIRSFHVFNIIINKEKTSKKLLKGDLSSCLNNIYSTNLSALLTKCCSDAGPLQFFAIYGEIAEITIFAGYPSTSFNPWICNFSNFSQFFAARAYMVISLLACVMNRTAWIHTRGSYEISSSSVSLNLM